MGKIEVRYCFTLDQGHQEVFELCFDDKTLENLNQGPEELPQWANLDFCQCPHCSLDPASHPHCPIAVNLVDIVSRFTDIVSYDEVGLTVVSKDRTVSQRTTAQQAISSLLGLLFATSACPHTQFFKAMACFHLPLATEEDTIFRAAGMYLLGQYFRGLEGQRQDLELSGLTMIYQNLHLVNVEIAKRLRSAVTTDSSVNAIIILDMFTSALPFVIKDKLQDIRHLFAPYFSAEFNAMLDSLMAAKEQ